MGALRPWQHVENTQWECGKMGSKDQQLEMQGSNGWQDELGWKLTLNEFKWNRYVEHRQKGCASLCLLCGTVFMQSKLCYAKRVRADSDCWHEYNEKLTNVWQGGILNGQLQMWVTHVSNPQKKQWNEHSEPWNLQKGPVTQTENRLNHWKIRSDFEDINNRHQIAIVNSIFGNWEKLIVMMPVVLQKWSTSASAKIALQVRLVYGAQDKATWKLSGILVVKAQLHLICKNHISIYIYIYIRYIYWELQPWLPCCLVLVGPTRGCMLNYGGSLDIVLPTELADQTGKQNHDILHPNFMVSLCCPAFLSLQKSRILPLKGPLWIESYFSRTRKLGRHVSAMWMILETVHPLRFKRRRRTGSSSVCAVFKSAMEMRARHILPSLLTAKRTTGNLPFAREQ